VTPAATISPLQARVLQVAVLAALFAAWEGGMRSGLFGYVIPNPNFWLSSPSAVLDLLWRLLISGRLLDHLWLTLSATCLGLIIGALLGTGVGVLMAASRTVEIAFEPIWSALNALPKVALAPAFAAALGLGISSKVALAVTLVFFVFLLNTIAGLHSVNPAIVNNLRLMGANRWRIFRMALMPVLLRWHYGALRISVGLALTAVVVGEFVAARGGVGFIIQYGFGTFNVTWCYAGIVVLGALALVLDSGLRAGQRLLTPWKAAP
jgi:NitT/TauT family transport system permease protein